MRPARLCLLSLVCACLSASAGAATLSVVPLANALQNPALEDTKSTGFDSAFKAVTDLLLNQPDEVETETARGRAAALANHRQTRVGKLFFAALAATPDIENADGLDFAAVDATWPIEFGGSISVRVEYRPRAETWLISALEVTAEGLAAAPIAGMAPYFGIGTPRVELLDLEAIDYLVGRSTADRDLPEADRPAFDFDAALKPIFAAEAGAFGTILDALVEATKSNDDRNERIEALAKHLATEAEVQAVRDADADKEKREVFWEGIRKQIAEAQKAPRPAAVPSAEGSAVRVRFRKAGSNDEDEQSAQRLAQGKIALGGVR